MIINKYFCRLITRHELDNHDVTEYYDVVTSEVPAKIVFAHSDDVKTTVEVIQYENSEGGENIYEIILSESIEESEGQAIVDELASVFDFDFEFETSIQS